MTALLAFVRFFVADEEGASMVEYAMLVAVIAIIILVAARVLGTNASSKMGQVADNMT
jgi:Flp pilus assembly pilin Flp